MCVLLQPRKLLLPTNIFWGRRLAAGRLEVGFLRLCTLLVSPMPPSLKTASHNSFLLRCTDIYLGTSYTTREEVAMKLESTRSRHPQLMYEAKLYRILQGGVGMLLF